MNQIIDIVGMVVIVVVILGLFGLRRTIAPGLSDQPGVSSSPKIGQ